MQKELKQKVIKKPLKRFKKRTIPNQRMDLLSNRKKGKRVIKMIQVQRKNHYPSLKSEV